MAYSGQERMVRAQNALEGSGEENLAKKQENSNTEAIRIKKFPLKAGKSEHNHSK